MRTLNLRWIFSSIRACGQKWKRPYWSFPTLCYDVFVNVLARTCSFQSFFIKYSTINKYFVGLNQGLIECDKTVTSIQILIFNITFESDFIPNFS
jgi:hypothetical protein